MPITSVASDPDSLTLTVVGDYSVSVERLWEAYSDPRQLERFWGPESWPAKFTRHDFTVGGRAHYTMTGPDGAQSSGWWKFLAIERPRLIEIEDGFAAADGAPNTTMRPCPHGTTAATTSSTSASIKRGTAPTGTSR